MATRIFKMIEQEAKRGGSDDELHLNVWKPTPWIVSFLDYEPNSREWFDLFEWCDTELGPESAPIHNKKGVWRRGNATVMGYAWWGFATEEMMNRFIERAPDRMAPNTNKGD